jgi:hypothetical protein
VGVGQLHRKGVTGALEDIGNTQRIRGVVLDGRWLDREALDGLPAHVQTVLQQRAPGHEPEVGWCVPAAGISVRRDGGGSDPRVTGVRLYWRTNTIT